MTVEIKELIVRATVQENTGGGQPAPPPAAGDDSAPVPANDAVIQACVREVLRILRREKER
jgi:hypothetical protein